VRRRQGGAAAATGWCGGDRVARQHEEARQLGGACAVVQLSEALNDPAKFTDVGIAHHNLCFDDHAAPPMHIIKRFCRIADAARMTRMTRTARITRITGTARMTQMTRTTRMAYMTRMAPCPPPERCPAACQAYTRISDRGRHTHTQSTWTRGSGVGARGGHARCCPGGRVCGPP
jgi:hypothetical protein